MTQGMVTGGWNFVVAAYSITAAVLVIYGITLIARLRDEERRSE
jgi:protein-S-isoprenylcysteine O-methyltransferase Ste14